MRRLVPATVLLASLSFRPSYHLASERKHDPSLRRHVPAVALHVVRDWTTVTLYRILGECYRQAGKSCSVSVSCATCRARKDVGAKCASSARVCFRIRVLLLLLRLSSGVPLTMRVRVAALAWGRILPTNLSAIWLIFLGYQALETMSRSHWFGGGGIG